MSLSVCLRVCLCDSHPAAPVSSSLRVNTTHIPDCVKELDWAFAATEQLQLHSHKCIGSQQPVLIMLVQVLDECHHTHSDHPYHKILKHYRQQSLEDQTSMQVHWSSMLVVHEGIHDAFQMHCMIP